MGILRTTSHDRIRSLKAAGAVVAAIWAALFALCACDGSDAVRGSGPSEAGATARDDGGAGGEGDAGASGAANGMPTKASIGRAGGTVHGPKGSVVEVPSGALSDDVDIGIAESAVGAPPLPSGFTAFGPIFALTPHGTQFAEPVTVTLPFDPANVPDGGKPGLYKTDAERRWVPVEGATFAGDHVTAEVSAFSWFVTGDPALVAELPIRTYEFRFFTADGTMTPEAIHPVVIGGELDEAFNFGENSIFDLNGDGVTTLQVYSSADGSAYCATADAPRGNPNPGSVVAGEALLWQSQSFIKAEDGATLSFQIDEADIEAVDFNGEALRSECPWGFDSLNAVLTDACDMLKGMLAFTVRAYDENGALRNAHGIPLQAGGYVEMNGHSGAWFLKTGVYVSAPGATYGIWGNNSFTLVQDRNGSSGREHPRASLNRPTTIEVDLSTVKRGHEFTVESLVLASAYNRRGRESGLSALLCDPEKVGSTKMLATGLVPTGRPLPPPSDTTFTVPKCTTASDPAAGVLELSAATYAVGETPFAGRTAIDVTRSGGSSGAVSVTLTLGGGDAVPGKDYAPLTTTVFFDDGDTTPRTVPIDILLDGEPEPDRTLNVTLADPGGCATLGDRSSAVLTIFDDDRPVIVDTYTFGGTVSGLGGKGLVLSSLGTNLAIDADGRFAFPRPVANGTLYDVRVESQPREPNQACVVENGRGNVAGADVTNIHVTCTTVPIDPALDSSFGVAGVVSTAFGGSPSAMVLQPDGKFVMAGAGFVLARYRADGTLDDGFGTGGMVTTDLGNTSEHEARAVALQSDGKIVVAGYTVTGRTANNRSNFDFTVIRYNPDGSLDGTFGTGGMVTTDFAGNTDRASAVLVQSDGKIVVAGDSSFVSADGLSAGLDFGIARYDASGKLDPGFGTGGKVTTDIAGGSDFARNLALSKDGAILVSGLSGLPGESGPDHTGVARYAADGKLDPGFGTGGKLFVRDVQLGQGLAVQSDGKLLLTGSTRVGGDVQFALMRLAPAGGSDTGFGTAGMVTTAFSTQDDFATAVTVQADGKILVAGQAANKSNSDFAVARYTADGKLDSSFGTGGKLVQDFFGSFDGAESVVVQPDGKIVAGGFARNGARSGFALLRTAQ